MHKVRFEAYAANGEYEQCKASFSPESQPKMIYWLALARDHSQLRFEVRDHGTLQYLFGNRRVVNRDCFGPLVLIDARRGSWGAITTSAWDLSPQESHKVYEICNEVRLALLEELAGSCSPALDLLMHLSKVSGVSAP